ncbi:MAG TPA: hypothetical protein VKY73_05810 [Polyangiaceae bacterium]|nr:hypothetical protein [Polyangiaceae bacterium]
MTKNKVHHGALVVLDSEDNELTGEDRRKALREFRERGTMKGAFFERVGGSWEDPEDPSTWGPEGPESVNWEGFDG